MNASQPKPIAFIDLVAQRQHLGTQIDDAVMGVINSGGFIMGPKVKAFEEALAAYVGAKHALSCANGTDALILPMMAWGIGAGDAVFCPSFTFAATGEVMPLLGATPVFVDIDPITYNLDPEHLEATILAIKAAGQFVPKAVIAVDLFGQPANYPAISEICQRHGLKLIADSAQGFGCTLHGHHPLHWADVMSTSFFPAKPLGCYGDGGAVLTNDAALHDIMDSLREHGKATASDLAGKTFDHEPKYLNMRVGMNSRLDAIQAAVLSVKLSVFDEEIVARNTVAARYCAHLGNAVTVPQVIAGGRSTWAQFTIEVPDRHGLAAFARARGIPTAAYYPKPIHTQAVYAGYPTGPGGLPVSEAKADRVLSLPMHPYLDTDTQDRIIATVTEFVAGAGAS